MKKNTTSFLSFVVTMLFIIYRHDIVIAIRNCTGSGTTKEIKYKTGKQFLKDHDLNSPPSKHIIPSKEGSNYDQSNYIGVSIDNIDYEPLPSKHGETICKGCNGAGYCKSCGGTGRNIREEYDAILERDVSVETLCPICNGTGYCGVCYGTGKIHY